MYRLIWTQRGRRQQCDFRNKKAAEDALDILEQHLPRAVRDAQVVMLEASEESTEGWCDQSGGWAQ